MQVGINAFTEKFTVLQKKCLPSLLTNDHKLMTHKNSAHKVNTYVTDQITASSSTSEERTLPSGQSLYDSLENMFYIEHEIRHLFVVQPDFFIYTDTDETLSKLKRHQLQETNGGKECWKFYKHIFNFCL